MLAIRMQRTGRSGHAQFRLIVQDSRFSPTSGRVVEYLGSYNPHTKAVNLDKDKATNYLKNGAQPSPRVTKLLKDEGVKLPAWVAKPAKKKGTIRNPEKLRRNRPDEPAAPEKVEPAAEADATPTEDEAPAEEQSAEETQVAEASTKAQNIPDPTPQAPPPSDAEPDTPGPAQPDEAPDLPMTDQ